MPVKHWQALVIGHLSRKPVSEFDYPFAKEILPKGSIIGISLKSPTFFADYLSFPCYNFLFLFSLKSLLSTEK